MGQIRQAGERGAARSADDRGFGDRRVDDAVRAEFRQQALRDTEDAAGGFALARGAAGAAGHVFTEHDDRTVALHFQVQRFVERVAE